MANGKPFLSGWFGKLASDSKASEMIRNKNLLSQLNALDADSQAAYTSAFDALGDNPTDEAINALRSQYGINDIGEAGVAGMAANPWKDGNAGKILGGYASAHPFKTAAGAGLGLMNLGGLTDNDYYGGQIGGALIGGLGSKFLGNGFSPMAAMAGGALGSLFDKLRQKQADAKQNPYQR